MSQVEDAFTSRVLNAYKAMDLMDDEKHERIYNHGMNRRNSPTCMAIGCELKQLDDAQKQRNIMQDLRKTGMTYDAIFKNAQSSSGLRKDGAVDIPLSSKERRQLARLTGKMELLEARHDTKGAHRAREAMDVIITDASERLKQAAEHDKSAVKPSSRRRLAQQQVSSCDRIRPCKRLL